MTDQTATNQTKGKAARRHLRGVVVSTGMAKTAVIQIDRRIQHPKYGKYFTLSNKFKVHDEHGKAHVGDVIEVEETRPLSKDKRWRYIKTIKAA
ncbi:30S ribosomal protein S17 [Patescibacteria group bacterium]|nr:30S ribosomal protein S17 [Patescibacteria group bacterium]MBU1034500.1 30S ribosomal protein S17 [Patescibacteria group bacterium]MBU1629831.1 30S ribosomal protein S17 [Patescibacteria group bacterium]